MLITEGLSHLINKANSSGNLTGLTVSTGPTITHLLFADDSLILCKAEESELLEIMDLLKTYELASGESINFSKSAILFSSKLNSNRKDRLSSILGVSSVNNFGKYLGVPSVLSRNKSRDFGYILDRVWNSVQGWKSSFFSIAGKEILIKSIGQAIPSFSMSVFRFPKSLCDNITKSFARFWWGSSSNKKKLHWFNWESLCLPKSLGGLNFRNIEGFNQALVAKQVWRVFTNPNSLISQFLKSLYFPNSSILEAEGGRFPSYLWKSMLWARELLLKGLRFRVGDGRNIKMFQDPWIPKESTFKPIFLDRSMINASVSDFITPSGN